MAIDRVTIVSADVTTIERLSRALRAAGFGVAPAVPHVRDLPDPGQHPDGNWVLLERRPGDGSDLVSVQDPGAGWSSEGSGMFAPVTLEEIERRHVAATLRHTGGNKRQAARLLGIARSTLQQKVRRYGLDRGVTE